jgi:hypothetical protein
LPGNEAAVGEVVDERLVDRRAVELEVGDVFGKWQLGNGELVLIDRACFSLISAVSKSPTMRWGSSARAASYLLRLLRMEDDRWRQAASLFQRSKWRRAVDRRLVG